MASQPAPSRNRKWMVLGIATIAIVAVTAYLWTQVRGAEPAGPGNQAPTFTASALGSDGRISLEALRGKPVLLNFWASWCGPCKAEAPLLNKAYKKYGGRVAFIGIDSNDARSDGAAFVKSNDLRYPNAFDSGSQIYRNYALTGQPETFFIDARGEVVAHVPGPLYPSLLRHEMARLLR